jgi:hypothetical protein
VRLLTSLLALENCTVGYSADRIRQDLIRSGAAFFQPAMNLEARSFFLTVDVCRLNSGVSWRHAANSCE